MKLSLVFATVMLVALSVCSAIPLHKRDNAIQGCPPDNGVTLDALTGTFDPDPPKAGQIISITVTATPTEDYPNDSVLGVIYFTDPKDINGTMFGSPYGRALCGSDVECPIKSGKQFTASVVGTAPPTLPPKYFIGVGIADKADSKPFACGYAELGGTNY